MEGVVEIPRNDFIQQFGSVFDSVFVKKLDNFEYTLKNPSWETMLIPYWLYKADDLDLRALTTASNAVGDERLIITDVGLETLFTESFQVPWRQELIDEVYCQSIISHVDNVGFGESGSWGLVSYYDDYWLLGGNKVFMDIYLQQIGGEEFAKNRFLEYAKNDWIITGDEAQDEVIKKEVLKEQGWL